MRWNHCRNVKHVNWSPVQLVRTLWKIVQNKRDVNGNIDRYQTRLVAKGSLPRKVFDYRETFTPVAWITTARIILAVSIQNDYRILRMDIKTAFLDDHLKRFYEATSEV